MILLLGDNDLILSLGHSEDDGGVDDDIDVDADHLALHVADLLHIFDFLLSSCCQSQSLLLLSLSIFEVRQFFFLTKSVVRLVMNDSTLALLN